METTPVIPDLKLKKVGKERKRGGAAWLGGNGARASFTGATGGMGSGIVASIESAVGPTIAAILPKALVAMLVMGLTGTAVIVGKVVNREAVANANAPAKKFAMPEPKSAAIPKAASDAGADSMNMVSGSLDGKTQAERDAEAAAAKAAADAKAQADAKAATDATKADAAPATVPDPAAAMAKAAGSANAAGDSGKSRKMGNPFGGASSSLGGSSGAGLSSSFGFSKSMDSAGRLGGNRGSAMGGLVALGAGSNTPGRASSPLTHARPSGGRALGQLSNAARLSKAGASSAVQETGSQNASDAFQPGISGDNAITGAGAGTGGAGAATNSGGSTTGGSGGGSGGGGTAGGGSVPMSTPMDDCYGMYPNAGYINSPSGGCVCPPNSTDQGGTCSSVTGNNKTAKYQGMLDAAKALLIAAAIMLLAAAVLGWMANSATGTIFGAPAGAALRAIAIVLCAIAGICSLIAMCLGLTIYSSGGSGEQAGGLIAGVGAITTALAAVAMWGYAGAANSIVGASTTATTSTTTMAAAGGGIVAGGGALSGGGAGAGGG